MLIYQPTANFDVKILFGKITQLLDQKIRKCWQRNGNYTFDFGLCRSMSCLTLKMESIQLFASEIQFKYQLQVNHLLESNVEFSFPCKPSFSLSLGKKNEFLDQTKFSYLSELFTDNGFSSQYQPNTFDSPPCHTC